MSAAGWDKTLDKTLRQAPSALPWGTAQLPPAALDNALPNRGGGLLFLILNWGRDGSRQVKSIWTMCFLTEVGLACLILNWGREPEMGVD